MDTKIKNYLGIALIGTLIVSAYGIFSFTRSYGAAAETSSFSTSAEGKVVTIPDIAQFSFSVVTQGGVNLQDTQSENTNKTNAAIAFAKSKGLDAKDISTQGYNVEPRYQYYNCDRYNTVCPPYEITGYTVTQTVLLKVRNFAVIGDLLSGVIQNGANTVSQLSFTVEDPSSLENQAREKAIAKAKDKAKSIAKAGGFRLGKLRSISEGSYYPVPMPMFSSAEGKGGATPAPSPTIEPGSYDVTINVSLTYEIR